MKFSKGSLVTQTAIIREKLVANVGKRDIRAQNLEGSSVTGSPLFEKLKHVLGAAFLRASKL